MNNARDEKEACRDILAEDADGFMWGRWFASEIDYARTHPEEVRKDCAKAKISEDVYRDCLRKADLLRHELWERLASDATPDWETVHYALTLAQLTLLLRAVVTRRAEIPRLECLAAASKGGAKIRKHSREEYETALRNYHMEPAHGKEGYLHSCYEVGKRLRCDGETVRTNVGKRKPDWW